MWHHSKSVWSSTPTHKVRSLLKIHLHDWRKSQVHEAAGSIFTYSLCTLSSHVIGSSQVCVFWRSAEILRFSAAVWWLQCDSHSRESLSGKSERSSVITLSYCVCSSLFVDFISNKSDVDVCGGLCSGKQGCVHSSCSSAVHSNLVVLTRFQNSEIV